VGLEDSYAHCRRVARRRAKNFYYAFRLLEQRRRDAMCALYAFMRRCDDVSDEPGAAGEGRRAMEQWRRELEAALSGEYRGDALWAAFHDTVRRFEIPEAYFFEMIEGVSSDLEPRRMETFEELYRYCHQVASVVGLSVVHVLGYREEAALKLAEKCGVAFQLTNILRDLKEDWERGRVYLPEEDLKRFGVRPWEKSPAFLELLRFEAARARGYYEESRALPGMVEPSGRGALWALIEIYRRLLERVERAGYRVLEGRVRLPVWEKWWVAARGMRGENVSVRFFRGGSWRGRSV
jgi:phytoene synthase